MIFPVLSIKVTTRCQLKCKNCYAVPWMKKHPRWDWSIESVERLIDATVYSGYHFRIVTISGGEPLLWENLIPALEMLRSSQIADKVRIFTNSVAVNESNIDWFEKIVELSESIKISKYIGNEKSIDLIKKYFVSNDKILISDRTQHNIQSLVPIDDTVPAHCLCNYPAVFGDVIYSCGGAKLLSYCNGIKLDRLMNRKIGKHYMRYFTSPALVSIKLNQEACKYCMANVNVRNKLLKEKNYCLKGKKNEARNDRHIHRLLGKV